MKERAPLNNANLKENDMTGMNFNKEETTMRDDQRFHPLNAGKHPAAARVAGKASSHSWTIVWDSKDEEFLLCDQMLHNIFYRGKALEDIEGFLDEKREQRRQAGYEFDRSWDAALEHVKTLERALLEWGYIEGSCNGDWSEKALELQALHNRAESMTRDIEAILAARWVEGIRQP